MSAPKRNRRTAKHYLYDPEWAAKLEAKTQEVFEARSKEKGGAKKRVAGGPPSSIELAEQHDAMVEEAKQSAVVLDLEAPPRRLMSSLAGDHPPREDNAIDRRYQVNVDTFFEIAVPLSIPDFADGEPAARPATDQELAAKSDEPFKFHPDWPEFADSISVNEWNGLCDEVAALTVGMTELPKSSLVSRLQALSDSESKSQQGGGSPRQRLSGGTSKTTPKQ